MVVQIEHFCSIDPTRQFLRAPFSQGEWTFATNGHIAVRVPRRSRVRERAQPRITNLFAAKFGGRARFLPVEPLNLFSRPCEWCENGIVRLSEEERRSADLDEREYWCSDCYGSGRVFPDVKLGRYLVDGRYITLAQQHLPGLRVAAPRQRGEDQPLQLTFDGGGCGLLTPMRSGGNSHVVEMSPRDGRWAEVARLH